MLLYWCTRAWYYPALLYHPRYTTRVHHPALPCPVYTVPPCTTLPCVPWASLGSRRRLPDPRDARATTPWLDTALRTTPPVTSSCSWKPPREAQNRHFLARKPAGSPESSLSDPRKPREAQESSLSDPRKPRKPRNRHFLTWKPRGKPRNSHFLLWEAPREAQESSLSALETPRVAPGDHARS